MKQVELVDDTVYATKPVTQSDLSRKRRAPGHWREMNVSSRKAGPCMPHPGFDDQSLAGMGPPPGLRSPVSVEPRFVASASRSRSERMHGQRTAKEPLQYGCRVSLGCGETSSGGRDLLCLYLIDAIGGRLCPD